MKHADPDRDQFHDWVIRVWLWLPFRKRFSREEYLELFRLEKKETRVLRRRLQFLLGALLSGGLALTLMLTGFRRDPIDWALAGLGFLIFCGYLCGIESTKEHFCERLLRLKQHPEEVQDI